MTFEAAPRDSSLADPLPDSPLPLLERWIAEAAAESARPNPDAMAVATVDAAGVPQVRLVLCRGFDVRRGRLVFYTNRQSPKGRQLDANPVASAAFYWDTLARQARITGPVAPTPDAESDAYFAGRHRLSQIAAWASHQSEPIASREALLERLVSVAERYGGLETGDPVPRPPHWGGYAIVARRVELWVGAEGRAHDRAVWERPLVDADADPTGLAWSVQRLQP